MSSTLYIAPATRGGNVYEYFDRTVLNGIKKEFYSDYTDENYTDIARVWGITSTFKTAWQGIKSDDWLLFYTRENKYEYAVQVSDKEHNPEMGDAIRRNIIDADERENRDWDLLIFLKEPVRVSVSGKTVAELLEYQNDYPVRFMRVIESRIVAVENQFGSVKSFIDSIAVEE